MDIIKRNWLLITIITVTLAVNGALGFLYMMTSEQVATAEKELEKQNQKVKETIEFQKKKYGLTKENKVKALENRELAWNSYDADYEKLLGKYGVAVYDAKYADTPFAAKGFIENRCESMTQDLESREVELAAGVKTFTFNDVIGKSDLPPKENVPFIIKNMLIVDDIVKILYQSELKGISQFGRTGLKVKDHEGVYNYLPFTLEIKGNYGAVRKFVNNLNDPEIAGFLYIIRNITLKSSDLLSTLGASTTDDAAKTTAKGDSKSARIAFKEMSLVSATIEFDYVEITKKEPN